MATDRAKRTKRSKKIAAKSKKNESARVAKRVRKFSKKQHRYPSLAKAKKFTAPLLKKLPKAKNIPVWIYITTAALGLCLMVASGTYLLYRQTILSFQVAPKVVVQSQYRPAEPKHIEIESVKIATDILPAQITNGIWQTSNTSASHLADSARPSEPGNIIIYAHNTRNLFERLREVKLDDTIILENAEGKRRTYLVESTHIVRPSEINLVMPTDKEILTVYTCTGFLDSMRFVVQAKLVDG
jgi:LPXTG-site transpeptidase (sortase) family protein